MPAEKIKKVNTLGSTISVWSKLVIGLIIFIVGIGTTYYKIESNAITNIKQDEKFKEILHEMTREFEIWGERSNKRYERAMGETEELHVHDDNLNKQLLDLAKEVYYLKGKLDQIENNECHK